MTTREISAHDWVKRWNEPVTLLLCSYFGDGYIHAAKDAFGVGFTHILFAYRDGAALCYRLQSDTEKIGRRLAEMLEAEEGGAQVWRDALVRDTDALDAVVALPADRFLEAGNFAALERQVIAYLPVFIRVNIVPDFLPPALLEQSLPYLEKARVYSEHAFHGVDAFVRKIVDEIGKAEGRDAALLRSLLGGELRRYAETKRLPSNEALAARQPACGLYINQESETILSSSELDKIETLIANKTATGDILKGTPSSKGRASGIARIVSNPRSDVTFNEGDILVTSMTNPDFIPLMKKAGAIITEGGGVLSHAAITSRELGKPSILSVINAMCILHDGDLVEVNADLGTVRIMERAE